MKVWRKKGCRYRIFLNTTGILKMCQNSQKQTPMQSTTKGNTFFPCGFMELFLVIFLLSILLRNVYIFLVEILCLYFKFCLDCFREDTYTKKNFDKISFTDPYPLFFFYKNYPFFKRKVCSVKLYVLK